VSRLEELESILLSSAPPRATRGRDTEPMADMRPDEVRAFLSEGTRTGKLATVSADGGPHVVPVWFVLDGDDVVFTTHEASRKGTSLRRDPRVALCVDDERPPYAYVMVSGTATLSTDADDLLRWATRIGSRYMGDDRAEEFGRRNGVPGELLVRITPTKIVRTRDVAG
jgi:PPOX class probable F420-dependent enzyme